MAKTANISLRTEPEVKEKAEKIYSSFGMSLSDAISVFLYQSINVGGLPFELRQPAFSQETIDAFQEAQDIIDGKIPSKAYDSVQDLVADIMKEGE